MTEEQGRLPFQTMTQGPFAALLRVPEEGFGWRDGLVALDGDRVRENTKETWLVRHDSLYVRQYPPLAIQSLHRQFASIEPTPESILAFANEFGFLGHTQWLVDTSSNNQSMPVGEPLRFWQNEIDRLARLIDLWELVKQERRQDLSHLVRWTPLGEPQQVTLHLVSVGGKLQPRLAVCLQKNPLEFSDFFRQDGEYAEQMRYSEMTVLAYQEKASDLELLERWKHGDPLEPARFYVHREVNNHQKGHVSPAVLPFRKGELFFFPDCLLSSLYTLFMLELSGRSRQPMLCERPGCGRYFQPEHGRQQYCEKRCQQLAYYYRKKEKERTI